jgi:hypothetical protein
MPPPRQIIMIDQSEIVRSLLYHIPAKNQPFTSIPGQGWYELFLKRLDTSSTNWYYVQKLVPAQLWLQPNLLHHDSSSCTKCCSTTRWLLGLSINILGQTLTPTKKKKSGLLLSTNGDDDGVSTNLVFGKRIWARVK